MKLVSDFKDFYDSVLMSLFRDDDKQIYIRKTEGENKDKTYNSHVYGYFTKRDRNEDLYFYKVFFCGEVYPYIVFKSRDKVTVFKNAKDYFAFLSDCNIKVNSQYGDAYRSRASINFFFDNKNMRNEPNNVAIALEQPDGETLLNPNLSQIYFQKVVDPYTAAMLFYNYVTGVLSCVCTPHINFTDKDILIAKGFDPKTSFRRM